MDSLMFNAGTLLQWYNCCAKILLSDFTLDFTHSAETQWYIQQQRRIQHKPNFQAIAANGHGLNALSGPFIPSALLPSCTIHVVIFTTQQRRVNLFFFYINMSLLSSLGLCVITHKQTHNNRIAAPRFCTLKR